MTAEHPPFGIAAPARRARRARVRPLLAAGCALCAMLAAPAAPAQDDPYLDMLSREAERLEFLDQARAEKQALQQGRRAPDAGTAPGPATREAFEQRLLKEFPGSYVVYLTLREQDRQEIFELYQGTGESLGFSRFLPVLDQIIKRSIEG